MYAKAEVNGRTIAETDNYEVVEGNVYVCMFDIDSSGLKDWFKSTVSSVVCPIQNGAVTIYNRLMIW